jgi:hypothetical protein
VSGLWTPGGEADAGGATDAGAIDLYPHERSAAEKIFAQLSEMIATYCSPEDFEGRAKEMFAKVGLRVGVVCRATSQAGVFSPTITINGRIEQQAFDPEKMAYEVQRVEGEEGTLDANGVLRSPSKSVAVNGTKSG